MAEIIGTSGPDTLVGTPDADVIRGLEGNDTLLGGSGFDQLYGGAGDDVYFIDDDSGDEVIELANEGNDVVYVAHSHTLKAGSSVEILSTNSHAATTAINLTGNALVQTLVGNAGANVLNGRGGADTLVGLGGNDTYYIDDATVRINEIAGGGTDTAYSSVSYVLGGGQHVETLSTVSHGSTAAINLTGNALVQTLVGNAGANVLNGRGGADTLVGLGGNDTYYIDDATVRINEIAGGGTDTAYSSVSYVLGGGQHVEILSTVSHGSTAAINLTGNALVQTLVGNAGANVLNGRGGADTLVGLGGNDTYYIDDATVRINEIAGGGTDTAYSSVSYVLGGGQHVETLSTVSHGSTAAINLTGNALVQTLVGNAGANVLNGRGGADTLVGLGGNDTYYIDDATVRINEIAGGGTDTAYSSVSYVLGGGQHVETLSTVSHGSTAAINLTGNALVQTLVGNAGANILNGGGGNDTLLGLGGNDTYYIDVAAVQVVEGAGGGADIIYSSVGYTLGAAAQVETLSTVSHGATNAINLTGNGFNNTLVGNAGANILNGGGGNDTLIGLAGADTFAFTIALGSGNVDLITDFAAGIDKIQLAGAIGNPFAALASGAIRAGTFVTGTAAADADDYLLYNSGTGALLYDADGSGAGIAVQFATLAAGLSLTAADFVVSGPANTAPAVTSAATASVAENSAASTIVYPTVATDADGDRITYSLTGTDAGLLNIDAVTGAVRLNAPADFETKASYSFNVVASDSGTSTAKAVTLTITDVADVSTPIINETGAPNNTYQTAQFIDRGTFVVAGNSNLPDPSLPSATIVGNLPDSADKDFFSITLQAGERLILDVDNSGGELDTHVRVYNSSGVEIGNNDDAGALDPGSAPHPVYGHNTDSFFSFRAPTAGTYFFSIESFQDAANPTFGTYEINVSIGPPATQAQIIEEDIQAMMSGLEWGTTDITYSFPNDASDYPANFGDPEDPEPASFAPFNAAQQAAVQLMLQHIAGLTALTFQQFFDPNDGAAKLRYAMTEATEAAHAYYPGSSDEAGSAWFNKVDFNTPQKGDYAWMGIFHETGHTLGLKHGHEAPALSLDRDSVEYSVMTYRSYPGGPITGYTNEEWGFPQTLMMYDIAALQRIYGANFSTNATNSVYTWNPTTGEMSINGAGQGAPGNNDGITVASENRVFMTVWDGGGTDTYNLSAYGSSTTIDLRPGEWTTTSAVQLADLGSGHFARGNIANALLFEGNTDSLIEDAVGGSGGDTIIANQVANSLTGGAGGDTFTWKASTDAGVAAAADTIADFLRGTDKIHLSEIDANPGTGANDPFTFIGTGAFTSVAGQLRYQVEGGNLRVQADLDGNGVADMEIIVTGNTIFAATDFFL